MTPHNRAGYLLANLGTSMKGLMLLSLVLPLALACSNAPNSAAAPALKQDEKQGESIGVAMMQEDGTIIMRLRARSPSGALGERSFVYPPTHPQYQEILSHIGSIRKGQSVPVKPWLD